MKKVNWFSNFVSMLALLSGSLWFGAYTVKLFVIYMLFKEEGLILKDYVTENNIAGIITTISPVFVITFICYIIFLICFTLFLVTSKLNLRQNGWLLIITLLIYITMPFEIYLMSIDYKFVLEAISGNINADYLMGLIIDSLRELSGFPLIIIFTYLTIPYFLVFKPFTTENKI